VSFHTNWLVCGQVRRKLCAWQGFWHGRCTLAKLTQVALGPRRLKDGCNAGADLKPIGERPTQHLARLASAIPVKGGCIEAENGGLARARTAGTRKSRRFHRGFRVDEKDAGGYSVTYRRDDIEFPVYVLAGLAAVLFATGFNTGQAWWLALGVAASGFTYYNLPLLETGRPTIGANQYGIFIQAFGLIRWRAIERIELVTIAERAMNVHELQIALGTPLASALVADWRKRPMYRSLMRLPWHMDHNNLVRVNIEPFDQPPDEIHRTLLRMWRYYRS
jgi:hypothetical protein